jgi:hypothetical protein
MLKAAQSKYFVIGNRPLATWQEILYKQWPAQVVYDWYILLPAWFKFHKGQKIIKFFGSNIELQRQTVVLINGEHTQTLELPQHITIHSNLVGFSNSGETSFDFDEGRNPIVDDPYGDGEAERGPLVKPPSESGDRIMIIPNKNKEGDYLPQGDIGGTIKPPAPNTGYEVIYKPVDTHNYYGDYVMLGNNFFTPKAYDISSYQNLDSKSRDFKIWFKDNQGKPLPILEIKTTPRYIEREEGECYVLEISQLIFKIECELMIL